MGKFILSFLHVPLVLAICIFLNSHVKLVRKYMIPRLGLCTILHIGQHIWDFNLYMWGHGSVMQAISTWWLCTEEVPKIIQIGKFQPRAIAWWNGRGLGCPVWECGFESGEQPFRAKNRRLSLYPFHPSQHPVITRPALHNGAFIGKFQPSYIWTFFFSLCSC